MELVHCFNLILKLRFASNKYSNESTKVGDVFTHLTNYSINKNSTTYMSNEDSTQAQVNLGFPDICMCFHQGHKWTLKSLWRHFDAEGIDHSVIWEKIKVIIVTDIPTKYSPTTMTKIPQDLMIKTIISAESNMSSLFQQNVSSRCSGK